MILSVSTSSIDFGRTYVGGTVSLACSIDVELDKDEDATVAVAVTGSEFAVTTAASYTFAGSEKKQSTRTETVTLTYTPTTAGSHTGSLTFSVGGTVEGTVSLIGEAMDEPWIDTDLTSLDFGTTVVGNTEITSVLIRVPTGDFVLDISNTGDSQLSVSPTGSKTVSDGSVISLTVTFSPDATGGYSGAISIPWTGPNGASGTLTVTLSGTGIEETTDDDATSTDGVYSSTDSTSTQRAIFYIPTYTSIVGLGASYVQDGTTMTQAGFSMSTTRHVFLRAGESATVQAEGNTWVQSTNDDIYLLSGNHSQWAAGKAMYVAGAGFTGIFTGYGGDLVDASNMDDSDLGTPDAVSEVETCILASDILWGLSDAALSILSRAKDLQEFLALERWKDKGWMLGSVPLQAVWNVAKLAGFMLFTVYSTISYVVAAWRLLPLQAVAIHAPGGILAGTPSYHAMWGVVGVGTTSLNNTQIGIVGISYEAGYRSLLDAVWGEASVLAGTELSMLGLSYWKHASRWDSINLYGKDIEIGGLLTASKQVPTLNLDLGCIQKASFTALMPSTSKVSMGGANLPMSIVILNSMLKAEFTQGNTFTIENKVFSVVCTPTKITISGPAGDVVTLTPGSITFGGSDKNIQLTPTAANIGAGSIQVTPTGLIANAAVVDLL